MRYGSVIGGRCPEHGGDGARGPRARAVRAVDSPPHRIERWRQGAAGERGTGRQLRRLPSARWVALHDIDTGRGNIDHIAVGPPGVFLLETKSLGGLLSVRHGVLTTRAPEEPDHAYDDRRLRGRVLASAAATARDLRADGISVWVQPVVVLWGRFEQASVLSGDVAWVRGNDLARVLAARPARHTPEQIEAIAAALRRA
jgi:hypothetical protein